jgi:hypothetical protein
MKTIRQDYAHSQDATDVGPLLPAAELMGKIWQQTGRDVQAELRRAVASWPGDRRGKVRLRLAALEGARRARGVWR